MTEQSSTVEDPIDLMTTTVEVTQQTATGSGMTSSSSRGVDFYFQCAVVVIGVVGTIANALIIYALVASKQYKKHLLIINQNALDLVGSVFLVITYTAKLCDIPLTGTRGYWLCATILSEAFVWWGILGSKIGLAIITIDRYIKIVTKKKLRKWMIYLAMVLSWSISLIYTLTVNFTATAVINGVCLAAVIWKNQAVKMAHGIWNFMSFYVIILSITVFCYARILIVIRRQAKVMASHNISQAQSAESHKIQVNVIKTMIIVSAFYAITNFPVDFYFLLANVAENISLLAFGYYASVIIVFLYSCANPVIYATQFDPVKRELLSLIRCKKNSVAASQGTGAT